MSKRQQRIEEENVEISTVRGAFAATVGIW